MDASPTDPTEPVMDTAPAAEPTSMPEFAPVYAPRRTRQVADDSKLRIVIVVWCFWLLGAWAVAWLSDTSVPRVRWMMFAGLFGLMLVWPAYRLSERSTPGRMSAGTGEVFFDWLAMLGVYQAVVWSLHLIAGWPIVHGLWLDAAVLSWSLLTALIVACARLWPGALARSVGMMVCIALVGAEPLGVWAVIMKGGEGWAMRVSPIQALWELTRSSNQATAAPWDHRIMQVGLVAVAGWSALWLWSLATRASTWRNKRANGTADGM